MNEEESKVALFALNKEYMSHKARERRKLYEQYRASRDEIQRLLQEHYNRDKEKGQKTR